MIPITKPFLGEEEAQAASEVVLSGWVTQGPKVSEFENAFCKTVGTPYACAVSNCTAALHLALRAVGVVAGDIVITVSHSFISTANSIRYCGAEPVFVDIDLATYNMSVAALERCLKDQCEWKQDNLIYKEVSSLRSEESVLNCDPKIGGGRVAAILVAHQMGLPCDLKGILDVANQYHLPVIEDAACAIGSQISLDGGAHWETIGKPHADIACFSFHPRKVITTGEGGMLTTCNQEYDKFFRLMRHVGMGVSDRARHESNQIIFEKYELTGYNYRMTDIQAAIGIEQLKKLPGIATDRQKLAEYYKKELSDIKWIDLLEEPCYARTNWQSFPVLLNDKAAVTQKQLMQILLDQGIASRRGIMNSHQEKPYMQNHFELPSSEIARDKCILLPLYFGISKDNINKIAEVLRNV